MKPFRNSADTPNPIEQQAAEWALRHDRGLTGAEQDEFSAWLAADARHGAAWAEYRWGWDELDRLAGLQSSVHAVPDPDLIAPSRGAAWLNTMRRHAVPALAMAAALLLALVVWWPVDDRAAADSHVPPIALIEQRTLSDGSVIELNRGAVVTEHFTAGERRVRLERGEAHFTVAKDSGRPFYVEAETVAVRAVGTAFNVRLESASVEVLVTEGRVGIERVADAAAAGTGQPVHLGMGERTVISLAPAAPPPQVAPVAPAEVEARLAWKPRLLDFTAQPLSEIMAEFNRSNPVRISVGDPALGDMRLSAAFRSDNVEGFVRLMQSDFGVIAERTEDGLIVLRKR
jgi:transmembrane sensor